MRIVERVGLVMALGVLGGGRLAARIAIVERGAVLGEVTADRLPAAMRRATSAVEPGVGITEATLVPPPRVRPEETEPRRGAMATDDPRRLPIRGVAVLGATTAIVVGRSAPMDRVLVTSRRARRLTPSAASTDCSISRRLAGGVHPVGCAT